MVAYENDVFTVPEALEKMSVSEIQLEKEKLLTELKKQKTKNNVVKKKQTNTITFKF